MTWRMILNETAWFGAGAINHIVDEVKRRGYKKGLVVTDRVLVECGAVDKVTSLLTYAGLEFDVFADVLPNPTIAMVQKGVEVFKRASADYLVAIGGGSPQDTCKAIGIIINNPEFADVRSLEGFAATRKPSVPIIAVPTTAGTAAEVTINYVITDEEKRRKFVCIDPHDIPLVSIIDSDMMATMPPALKAATGIDALTHAIEGFTTRGAWEMTDMLHLKAISLISRSLVDSVAGKSEGGEGMALAQYIAGMGFSNVGLGLVHGMAHPLGAFYNMPHGVANAILLPHVMEWNADYTGEKYRDIAHAMGVENAHSVNLADARRLAVDAVRALCREVGIPQGLTLAGASKEDIPQLAQAALDDVCTGGNPRTASLEEIKALYELAM
ncbi:TPA: lactaldehyde reductase [Citrobacter farmeri]|uniref:Lactaldehyde reductase n=1 Tax=Citrobacter amalonaticus TaxID=35703 RepID=A0A6N2XKV1_CITAM|nr:MULTISPECIES: lactaldehyde reductase [Citrobacter]MBN6042733.1 lactaldehyde reductase [Citrobacter sp. ku-bf4]MBS0824109.1 lactaldehyde reductase [Citrobacter amalonaticus]QXA96315.1 lactaldehyde reductase [Citrobacter farmeri]UYF55023.1 lactaldehyde reductase [Citrobacter amalonaticus]GAL51273.1 lactaldehyde reductase [Citrobacter farmeri GTC 1319]